MDKSYNSVDNYLYNLWVIIKYLWKAYTRGMKPKRRQPPLTATTIQGRPMANLGLKRLNKKLRKQIKTALKQGRFELDARFR